MRPLLFAGGCAVPDPDLPAPGGSVPTGRYRTLLALHGTRPAALEVLPDPGRPLLDLSGSPVHPSGGVPRSDCGGRG